MNLADLSPRQQDVVGARDHSILVTGGAGTGKTTAALWAARVEMERSGNEKKRVLFLTFSRTAVEQISSRSRSAVSATEDRIEVSTFHSFAYRLVRQFGYLTGATGRDPSVQSASEMKLLGRARERLAYDDLAPLARTIMEDPRVAALLAERWCLVVCDEFQDTGDDQWAILERLSCNARLLLLGDEHQLIYGFLARTGVVPERMTNTRAWVDRVIELEPASHRDPSGAIPALATAIRERRFNDGAVLDAITDARLHLHSGIDDSQVIDAIRRALDDAWARGCRTFGVFAHTNHSVAELSFRLHEAGIDHYLVGLPDAEADALLAMLAITRYAYGDAGWPEAAVALGTYLTGCSRGREAPALARHLASGARLSATLQRRIDQLRADVTAAADSSLNDVAEIAASAWPTLGITGAQGPWKRTAPAFRAVARRANRGRSARLAGLTSEVMRLRLGAMFENQRRRLPTLQVMNLHQTKGREVDSIILLCSDDDYHGNEREPYVEGSRLLYVVLTRARREITVLLGNDPHGLVAPMTTLG